MTFDENEFKLDFISNIELIPWSKNFESNVYALINLISHFNELIELLKVSRRYKEIIDVLLENYIGNELEDMSLKLSLDNKKAIKNKLQIIENLAPNLESTMEKIDQMIESSNKKNEQIRPAKNRLLLINIWSIYESFTKNLWVFLLNKYPTLFNTSLVENKKKDFDSRFFEFSRKSNFQNSKVKIGDLILDCGGIRFSSYKNIQDNYKKLFAKYIRSESKIIFQIEKTRHLITHNLGVIDEDYMKNMKRIGVNVEIGKELEKIDDSMLAFFIKEICYEVNNLLQFLDGELTRLKETNVIPA